eukprot:6838953-Lingulodinium_polyedra.AAC.1
MQCEVGMRPRALWDVFEGVVQAGKDYDVELWELSFANTSASPFAPGSNILISRSIPGVCAKMVRAKQLK